MAQCCLVDALSLRERVARLPRQPGVYLWKDGEDNILYVGKAKDLRGRATQYVVDGAHKPEMMVHAMDIDYIAVATNKEALLLEQTLIKRHKPRYNVLLADDKQYPYIKLTNDPYPRLVKTHRRLDDGATYFGPFPDGYGAYHVMQILNDLFPLRRCRTLPKDKCLYYDIGKCIAPCIDACTDAEYAAVVEEVKDVLAGRSRTLLRRTEDAMKAAAAEHRFEDAARLRDQLKGLQGVLERQHMVQDRLQDRDIAAIEARGDLAVVVIMHQRDGKVIGQSPFVVHGVADASPQEALADFLVGHYADRTLPRYVAADIDPEELTDVETDLRLLCDHPVSVEAPQRGDKRRWLEVAQTNARLRLEEETLRRQRRGMGAVEALQAAIGLADPPRVIEGFDISHQAGHHTRAAMVRFVDGKPDKAGYRTFGMQSLGEDAIAAGKAQARHGKGREIDDFASMAEAVGRRYRRLLDEGSDLPDLILIDGGPGQLGAARQALQAIPVDIPLVAIAKQDEELFLPKRLHPILLGRDHAGLQLLQRVRDEAHRFGITQVRRKARQAVTRSPLDTVAGIGPKRRAELVKAFGGMEGLRAASPTDLQKVPGITDAMAQAIVAALADIKIEEPRLD